MAESKKQVISIYNEEVAKDIRNKVHKKVLRLLDIRGASVEKFKESFNGENISKIVLLDDNKFECTYETKVVCTDCKWLGSVDIIGSQPEPIKEKSWCYHNSKGERVDSPLSRDETTITQNPYHKNAYNHCKDYSPTLLKRITEYLMGLRDAWRYIR